MHLVATATACTLGGELHKTTRFILVLIGLQHVHVSVNPFIPNRGFALDIQYPLHPKLLIVFVPQP